MAFAADDLSKSGIQRTNLLICVFTGTTGYKFERMEKLVKKVSSIYPDKKVIFQNTVFVGAHHQPSNVEIKSVIKNSILRGLIEKSDFIITHAGSGIITESLTLGKSVFVLPRKAELDEHVDNHQFEIARVFEELNFISLIDETASAETLRFQIEKFKPQPWLESRHRLGQHLKKKYL